MRKYISVLAIAVAVLAACKDDATPAKNTQAIKAKEAANSINFAENAEIENIKKRLQITSNPGLSGYILLMNEMGQPVMYTGVKGKVTSGSKRLTEPDRAYGVSSGTINRAAPSDEGTYGTSGEYIFFWNMEGQYIQWNGKYLYSDKPFRVRIEPLVIN